MAVFSCSESWKNIADLYCVPISGPSLLGVVGSWFSVDESPNSSPCFAPW